MKPEMMRWLVSMALGTHEGYVELHICGAVNRGPRRRFSAGFGSFQADESQLWEDLMDRVIRAVESGPK